jgi:hypothetical protein
MPAKFRWEAENEVEWADESTLPGEPSGGRSRLRIALSATLIILLAIPIAIFIKRTLDKQIETNTNSIKEDVISTHQLVKRAAASHDIELLATFMSGRSDQWLDAQVALANRNEFESRQSFGFVLKGAEDLQTTVTMSPDLRAAELVEERAYQVQNTDGSVITVRLGHPYVYRSSSSKWLLSPPLEDYWGDEVSLNGRYFNLSFPQRDEEISKRLAADIEAALASACVGLPTISCPDDVRLQIHLSTDPLALLSYGTIEGLSTQEELILPAPSLVGLPVDDTAYRFLRRSYAAQVVSRQILTESDYTCCRRSTLIEAFLAFQLLQTDLSPWPLTTLDYARILETGISLQHVGRLFQLDGVTERVLGNLDLTVATAFAGFIATRDPTISMEDMMHWLITARSLEGWLFNVMPERSTSWELELAWAEHVERQAGEVTRL